MSDAEQTEIPFATDEEIKARRIRELDGHLGELRDLCWKHIYNVLKHWQYPVGRPPRGKNYKERLEGWEADKTAAYEAAWQRINNDGCRRVDRVSEIIGDLLEIEFREPNRGQVVP